MTVSKYYDEGYEILPKPIPVTKPEWHHENFAYDLAKFIHEKRIVEIKHDWEMTSADTASYWAILIADDKTTRKIGSWHHYMKITADHGGLVRLEAYIDNDVRKILDWEKAHAKKIKQYESLKKELGL